MTDAAIIQGTFSDFKLIKTRSTCQLVIEVPIEAADQALTVLGGVPRPGEEKPVAVARLASQKRWEMGDNEACAAQDNVTAECTAAQPEADDARTARQSADSDAPEPRKTDIFDVEAAFEREAASDPATECAARQPEADAIAREAQGAEPYHYSRQAGMRCNDIAFRRFLADRWPEWVTEAAEGPAWDDEVEGAAIVVRQVCQVQSRAEFDTDADAARRWRGLMAEFDKWRGLV